ncbi:hypothetical protein DNTS_006174 [Danionella cerebrum]|uniref:DnaJ homolog subfamily B member 14 n=1 Tax=Danionella cerebrum TaxID=2873325 RepID=A0A553N0U2_9TELE|nr:hypothetical protein DNTS_006174 [Danionella translucida]
MEGNRDEAVKCLNIAVKALDDGEKDKAIKFLRKAEKLYSTEKAKVLLERLLKNNASPGNTTPHCRKSSTGVDPKSSFQQEAENQDSTASFVQKGFTKEQAEGVQRIKQCKDFYEVLNVRKDASEEDFKKAYKQLALKFHPDKNHAPGATDAFKKIGNAYAVLSNPEKKRQYDFSGEGEPSRGFDFYRGFESDMKPEDGGFSMYIQLIPIVVLVLVSILSQLLVSTPPYSLFSRPSSGHTVKRQTENLHVDYFVTADFNSEYTHSALLKIEKSVEDDYVSNVRNNCWKERQTQTDLLYAAKVYRDQRLQKKAELMTKTNCKELDRLNLLFRGG